MLTIITTFHLWDMTVDHSPRIGSMALSQHPTLLERDIIASAITWSMTLSRHPTFWSMTLWRHVIFRRYKDMAQPTCLEYDTTASTHLLEYDGENAPSGLVHVAFVPRPRQSIDLVYEDDGAPQVIAGVEYCAQLLFRLAVPLGHDALHWNVHHRLVRPAERYYQVLR